MTIVTNALQMPCMFFEKVNHGMDSLIDGEARRWLKLIVGLFVHEGEEEPVTDEESRHQLSYLLSLGEDNVLHVDQKAYVLLKV